MVGGFNKNLFFTWLEKLARAKGPSLSEEPRRKVLESFFSERGIPTMTDKAGNLLVVFGPEAWDKTVVLDAHMDVVHEGYSESVVFDDEKITGLGVADDLTAVVLLALYSMELYTNEQRNEKLKRPLLFLFSMGEEGYGNLKGIRQVVSDHDCSPYLVLSFDLSMEEYSVSGLGSIRYRLSVTCPGGHSWEDYGKPGAIDVMMDFLSDLKKRFTDLAPEMPRTTSFNIGTVKGGEGINSIPRSAQATFEFRSVYPFILKTLHKEVIHMTEMMNGKNGVNLVCEETGIRPAAGPVLPEGVEAVVLEILSEVGESPRSVVRSTNINATLEVGWPSLSMGLCKSGRFHSPMEYVMIDSLEKGWFVLNSLVKTLAIEGKHP